MSGQYGTPLWGWLDESTGQEFGMPQGWVTETTPLATVSAVISSGTIDSIVIMTATAVQQPPSGATGSSYGTPFGGWVTEQRQTEAGDPFQWVDENPTFFGSTADIDGRVPAPAAAITGKIFATCAINGQLPAPSASVAATITVSKMVEVFDTVPAPIVTMGALNPQAQSIPRFMPTGGGAIGLHVLEPEKQETKGEQALKRKAAEATLRKAEQDRQNLELASRRLATQQKIADAQKMMDQMSMMDAAFGPQYEQKITELQQMIDALQAENQVLRQQVARLQ